MRALRLVTPALTTISLTAGVLLAAPVSADPKTVTPALTPTVQVSVMTQNIFYGGDDYDLSTGDFCPVANGCPRALHRLAHII